MYQRNGKWYSDFWYEGKRYTKGYGAINKTVAKEKERKFRNEVASGEYESRREKIEFEAFVVKYLKDKKATKKSKSYYYYIDSVKPLLKYFRGKRLVVAKGKKEDSYSFEKDPSGGRERIKYLSDIHPFMLQQFKHERKKVIRKGTEKEITGCTVNKSLKCLRNMFNLAIKWKMAKGNPARGFELFKESEDDVIVLTREKEAEFFKALETERQAGHMKVVALLAIYTGMRKREILDLEKGRVNIKDMYLTLTDTKNGEKREIPLTSFLTKALEGAINKSPKGNPYVFPSPRTGKPFTEVRKSLSNAMKKTHICIEDVRGGYGCSYYNGNRWMED